MNREATEKLRLDRRLMHRPRWISRAELEKELEALPDVSDKIAPPSDSEPTAAGQPPGQPDPARVE